MTIATVTARGFIPGAGNIVLMGFGNGFTPLAPGSLHATIPTEGYGADGTIASVTLRNYGNTANQPFVPPTPPADIPAPPSRGGPPLWWLRWVKKYEDECPSNVEEVLEDLTAKEEAELEDAVEEAVYAIKHDQHKLFREAQAEYQRVFTEIDCLMKGEIRGLWAQEVKFRMQEEEDAMELMHLANEFFTFFD